MIVIRRENFSIRQICQSGQCFRLERLLDREGENIGWESYGLTALGRHLSIGQRGKEISFGCTREEFEKVWKDYFDLEEDYGRIISAIDKEDGYLREAAAFGSGIRILRQDLWEMIVSFIISQQNNIKRIRKCIEILCTRYGQEKRTESGQVYYDFPTPQALAGASLEELCACNLGYRSRYVHETALLVAEKEMDLEAVKAMDYGRARQELLKLRGVGVKVADCICLFALHKTQAFPVDTHIKKVLKEQYPQGFPMEKYQGYEGTLQQYIFYYDLMKDKL